MEMCKCNFFYRFEKKFSRIWLIILDVELPLGNLYIVQRFLSCLSASCPKRLQILFSVALYFFFTLHTPGELISQTKQEAPLPRRAQRVRRA